MQKQMMSMMYASTAKTEEEIKLMTPDEKSDYLRSRLHQKLNIGSLQRKSNTQKTKMQEKLQGESEENTSDTTNKSKSSKKNAKKREKERVKRQSELQLALQTIPEVQEVQEVQGVQEDYKTNESDYESDDSST